MRGFSQRNDHKLCKTSQFPFGIIQFFGVILPIRMTCGIPQVHWIQTRHTMSAVQYSNTAPRGHRHGFLMLLSACDPLFRESTDVSESLINIALLGVIRGLLLLATNWHSFYWTGHFFHLRFWRASPDTTRFGWTQMRWDQMNALQAPVSR